jgi:hypothetical protein
VGDARRKEGGTTYSLSGADSLSTAAGVVEVEADARWAGADARLSESGWNEDRRENPRYASRPDTSCILQILMQRLVEALQLAFDLHFADAHPGEEPAGDSLTKFVP